MEDKDQIKLTVLTLRYERCVSKAHTIFSSFWDVFFGVIVGGWSAPLF